MSKDIDELVSFIITNCNKLDVYYGCDNSVYTKRIKNTTNKLISENVKLKKDNELLKTALNEMVDISSRINILQSDSI